MENKLHKIKVQLKSGSEKLKFGDKEIQISLLDFWRWSVSDLLSNTIRGRFAEFIVKSALEINGNILRVEWDSYDLKTDDGIKIEVKSSAYIQSWEQEKYSEINFSIKPTRHYDAENKFKRGSAKRHADLYVFCILNHKNQETINPLQLEQWTFYVLSTFNLEKNYPNKKSISLKKLDSWTKPVNYFQLNEKVRETYQNMISVQKITP
ncbi:hypothetical protein MWN41_11915 [Ornithobacterium rhinotracheale]|uniref:hypothetical protein n=1 Tax=Ornithobacterium rhinotracheale TaxID=28251 RepID=UPI001FF394FC|nr:hypothetical protein [Ornithobacterium rhinotracheale]MCK0203721.1 hypothetical protein [Ornithobacterium rhinotracheale]